MKIVHNCYDFKQKYRFMGVEFLPECKENKGGEFFIQDGSTILIFGDPSEI